jgi:membrane peptidoglycan carboxypeptidase
VAADPTRPNSWLTLSKLVAALTAVGVLAAGLVLPYVGGLGLFAGKAASKFLNTTCNLQESAPPQKTTVYARDGKTVIATLFSQDRQPIPLTQIPTYLQQALIATEDRRFYQHHGVDLRGLIRSAVSTTGGDTQGGSTLTMQYVKQVRYYQAGDDKKKQAAAIDQNLQRKMEDAKCALYIEGTLHKSKATILDDYLNIAFFGEHSYGIQTAAETYFNKPASQLSLTESALLVGMLRAPSAYDPFQNRTAAKERRDEVLQNLVSVGKLGQAAADKAKATPVALATQHPPQVHQGCANASGQVLNAAFFCDYVVNWLETVNGMTAAELQTGGYKIVTTLDPKLQNRAQQQMNDSVAATSPMTAVLPAVNPKNGDILAMAASKTYGLGKGETEQPIFTKYTAPGASTFKLFPLLVALSTGVPEDWKLTTVGNTGSYPAKNCPPPNSAVNGDASENYDATETLETATQKSDNSYFLALADQLLDCNLQPIIDLMGKLGMSSLQEHNPGDNPKLTYAQNLVDNERAQQLVLGSVPVSPLELAGAYAAVADGGKYYTPAPVLSIMDSSNKPVQVKREGAGVQVVAPQVAAKAVDIMTGDTHDFGTSKDSFTGWYAKNDSFIAGKTGTNESTKKDKNGSIWFVGMTPDLVAASGVINFDNTSVPSSGLKNEATGAAYGDFAAKVWIQALQSSLVSQKWQWPDPQTVSGIDVTDVTGMSLTDAKSALEDQQFKVQVLDNADSLRCPSSETLDTVGYYGPKRAEPGSTVTLCLSSGEHQDYYIAPVIHKKPPKHPGGTGTGTGTGTGAPGGGGSGGGGSGGAGGGGAGSGNGGGGHSTPGHPGG